MNGLTQNVWAVRSHERRDLDAIHDSIEAGCDIRFSSDGIDAGIGAATIGQFLDSVVDVLLLEIERHGAEASASASRSGTVSMAMTRSARNPKRSHSYKETLAACDREWHDDPVANLERLVLGSDLDDFAHRLMAEHVALFHRRHEHRRTDAGPIRRSRTRSP
jgi:hypothetical protein